jgi:uncharacterized protein (DUF488 family)
MQVIYTIGHSTRPIEEFITLLRAQHITQLVDVRTIPRSRHNPQYEQPALEDSLADAGISYLYMKELGGLRPAVKDSINTSWHNASFRNYADYMQTDDFKQGVEKLIELSRKQATAIMCAEAVPWRCHRSLIGDALLVRGHEVRDIMSETNVKPHALTSFAVVEGTNIVYSGETS